MITIKYNLNIFYDRVLLRNRRYDSSAAKIKKKKKRLSILACSTTWVKWVFHSRPMIGRLIESSYGRATFRGTL